MAASLGSHLGEREEAAGATPAPGPAPAPPKPQATISAPSLRPPLQVIERNAQETSLPVSTPASNNPVDLDVRVDSHITMSQEEVHQQITSCANTFQMHGCVVNIYTGPAPNKV